MEHSEQNIVSDIYENYHETQKEILAIDLRKTRNKLITIALVIFIFDLLAILAGNLVTFKTLLWIAIVPAIIFLFAFLSGKEPLLSMILATVLIAGIWIYTIVVLGGIAVISGWIGKAVIIYLIFAGFQHARDAHRIKKELGV